MVIRFGISDSWKLDWMDLSRVHRHEEGSGRQTRKCLFGAPGLPGLSLIAVLRQKERMATIPNVGHNVSEGLDVQGSPMNRSPHVGDYPIIQHPYEYLIRHSHGHSGHTILYARLARGAETCISVLAFTTRRFRRSHRITSKE